MGRGGVGGSGTLVPRVLCFKIAAGARHHSWHSHLSMSNLQRALLLAWPAYPELRCPLGVDAERHGAGSQNAVHRTRDMAPVRACVAGAT